MADACRGLGVPVVGGNVSLYNESRGVDIAPTPILGMLGVVDRLDRRPPGVGLVAGQTVMLLGEPGRELGGSRWAWTVHGHHRGRPPALDLDGHRRVLALTRGLVVDGLLGGVHDCADGGAGLALAEMAVRSGVGFRAVGVADHVQLFGESPSRVLASVAPEHVPAVSAACEAAGVRVTVLGPAGGDRLVVDGLVDLSLADAVAVWTDRLPAALGAGTVH
jgi:phosphoribosylformylglycinamidine synthase